MACLASKFKLKYISSLTPLLAINMQLAMADTRPPNTGLNNWNYPASFFEQYTPQNAFEMIERSPGFSFDAGSEARGFGGNAGNVLIDMARPRSKSGDLRGALARIPFEQVVRIEILRGGGATRLRANLWLPM